MNRVVFLFIFLLFGNIYVAFAQIQTMELNEIVVEGDPFEKFMPGSKTQKSDSLQMAFLGQGTLSDFMQQNTTVYIKEQGNKMLASVSFRGTGSSHTAVFWNGISLNSLTLGNSDFNGVPLFLFDEISVHYGGASSLQGSDAIGGSIHLGAQPSWTDGAKIQFRQDFGSFENVFSGIKIDVGNGKWESKTRVFNRILKNNFTYNIIDRIGDSYEIEQKNAQVHNAAIIQEFSRKIASRGYLTLKGWLGSNYHQIQPLMVSSPNDDQSGDEIQDKNLRLIGEYKHFFGNGILQSGIGYVWDYQIFNNTDVIEMKRILSNLSYEWNIGDNTNINAGGNTKYIVPNVWSYEDDLTEWRGDVFLSINHEMLENWQVSLNARKTFVPFTKSPIAPSISTSYMIDRAPMDITFRLQVERSYRIPTFNDRYWGVQGRPDLKSENGYSIELGQHLLWEKDNYSIDFDIAAYHMKIEDWIAWKPAGNLWRPFNLKEVEASGIELTGKWKKKWSRGEIGLRGMYAYNRTELLKGITEDDPSVGYQLPYTPKHRLTLNAQLSYHKFRLSINNNFTGKRYGVDVINEEIDEYIITNVSLGKTFSIGKHSMSLEGQVLNLLGTEYQNVNRYAMPGRNYLLSINFLINQ